MFHVSTIFVNFIAHLKFFDDGSLVVWELVTDLFNLFSLEFLGALEHLAGATDVIYAGQLPPVWGIRGNAISQFPQIWRVFTPFPIWPNFAQKKLPNKRTLKF